MTNEIIREYTAIRKDFKGKQAQVSFLYQQYLR